MNSHRALNSILAGLGTGGAADPVHDVVLLSGGKSFEDILAPERGFQVGGDNVVRAVPCCRAALDRAGEDTRPYATNKNIHRRQCDL